MEKKGGPAPISTLVVGGAATSFLFETPYPSYLIGWPNHIVEG